MLNKIKKKNETYSKKKRQNKAFSKSLWNLCLASIWTLAHIYNRLHEFVFSVCDGHYWVFSAVGKMEVGQFTLSGLML